MTAPYRVSRLQPSHDRSRFSCGVDALDRYLRERAMQDERRRVAACFVALAADGSVAGYYTLAMASVWLADLPPKIARKLPRYPAIPAARLGRLAVAVEHRGRGLGGALLADAEARACAAEIAAFALIVDAKDGAEPFYRHHGFLAFGDDPGRLFLPLASRASG